MTVYTSAGIARREDSCTLSVTSSKLKELTGLKIVLVLGKECLFFSFSSGDWAFSKVILAKKKKLVSWSESY